MFHTQVGQLSVQLKTPSIVYYASRVMGHKISKTDTIIFI